MKLIIRILIIILMIVNMKNRIVFCLSFEILLFFRTWIEKEKREEQ